VKKIVLIIGYGSIGKRHAKILSKFNDISRIYVLTKQTCKKFYKIKTLSEIKKINPDYFIIASRTSDHLKHLSYLEKNFKRKVILVEKPIFEKFKRLRIHHNKVFIGYNLRYHPLINFIKDFVKNKKIFSININCQSYLPNWRKNMTYSESNSAKKKYGGGVLLELSHEIDYLQWIFKKITNLNYAIVKKLSNLKIDTEDYASIIGKTLEANFYMNLNFFSFHTQRQINISGNSFSLKGDLIKNTIQIFEKNKKKIKTFKIDENYTYRTQHRALLNDNYSKSCTYNEGLQLISIIDKIRKFKSNV
jgi:predicted dehydrogenase